MTKIRKRINMVNRKFSARNLLVSSVAAVALVVSSVLTSNLTVQADEYEGTIRALESQINEAQEKANQLSEKSQSLQEALDKISNEKNMIEKGISLTEIQLNKLESEIEEAEDSIRINRKALGVILVQMSLEDDVSPLERIAGSDNISTAMDKFEYKNSVKDSLGKKIEQIKVAREELESKRKEVDEVLSDQRSKRSQLVAVEGEQAALLKTTKGEEAEYQKFIADSKAQHAAASAAQRAYYKSLSDNNGGKLPSSGGAQGTQGALVYYNFSGNMGCSGGYPYCAGGLDYTVDQWALYARECVSYAAWRIQYGYGRQVNPFRGQGMAHEWSWSAPRHSKAVVVSNPQPGDAVVLGIVPGLAPVGHLMVVESVNGDNIRVSQYNFGGTGEYSTMDISRSGSRVTYLRFPRA